MPEAPFLFSIAGLSLSLAGLAGLVAGLRRGAEFRAIEFFRLREIVEFAFATALIALSGVPLAALAGDTTVAFRSLGGLGALYLIVVIVVLEVRRRANAIPLRDSPGWIAAALVINLAALVAAVITVATGNPGAGELMLLALLARPMVVFLLVLDLLRQREGPRE